MVFHGDSTDAKGGRWLLEVARAAPQLSFLFPFERPKNWGETPANSTFRAMRWESGLEDAVSGARVVANPSLWSAPIEGALVKSLAVAQAVAIAANDTAFGHELPPGLVLCLPVDTTAAARALSSAVASRWSPEPGVKSAWVSQFDRNNRPVYKTMLRVVGGLGGEVEETDR